MVKPLQLVIKKILSRLSMPNLTRSSVKNNSSLRSTKYHGIGLQISYFWPMDRYELLKLLFIFPIPHHIRKRRDEKTVQRLIWGIHIFWKPYYWEIRLLLNLYLLLFLGICTCTFISWNETAPCITSSSCKLPLHWIWSQWKIFCCWKCWCSSITLGRQRIGLH